MFSGAWGRPGRVDPPLPWTDFLPLTTTKYEAESPLPHEPLSLHVLVSIYPFKCYSYMTFTYLLYVALFLIPIYSLQIFRL
jgi:hypothetical protein